MFRPRLTFAQITPPPYYFKGPLRVSSAAVSAHKTTPFVCAVGSWDNAPELAGSGAPSPPDDGEETEHPRTAPNLNRFPWYHGNLSRNDAAKMVQGAAHGVFLLRRSETRPSTYVLTFNVNRRAKVRVNCDWHAKHRYACVVVWSKDLCPTRQCMLRLVLHRVFMGSADFCATFWNAYFLSKRNLWGLSWSWSPRCIRQRYCGWTDVPNQNLSFRTIWFCCV